MTRIECSRFDPAPMLVCEGRCGNGKDTHTLHGFVRREAGFALHGDFGNGWDVIYRCSRCAAERIWGFEVRQRGER